jgi:hypothetical protein
VVEPEVGGAEGAGAGAAGATELDEVEEPEEDTECEPLHELEYSIGFSGAGKSPQKLPLAVSM